MKTHRTKARRVVHGLAVAGALGFFAAPAWSQALIGFSGSIEGVSVTHSSPDYIAKHIDFIEARPFDGIVINDYLGRNLLNAKLAKDAPGALNGNGAVTYDAAARGLSPLKGVFKKFQHNFAKINLGLVDLPPVLSDDAGWRVINESAENYARAVHDTGLAGLFFDNENYVFPPAKSRAGTLNYWIYADQLELAGQVASGAPLGAELALARRRGREFMQALSRGFPAVVVINAHGPFESCDAWRALTRRYASNDYLAGAFTAGMIEAATGPATLVDGGEDYDLRTAADYASSKQWRKGSQGTNTITSLDPRSKCPFMDPALAALWSGRVNIAFSTFDKERVAPGLAQWRKTTDVAAFRASLTNALRSTDRYVWHYSEWQDWWGDATESQLGPWVAAIVAARHDAGAH